MKLGHTELYFDLQIGIPWVQEYATLEVYIHFLFPQTNENMQAIMTHIHTVTTLKTVHNF